MEVVKHWEGIEPTIKDFALGDIYERQRDYLLVAQFTALGWVVVCFLLRLLPHRWLPFVLILRWLIRRLDLLFPLRHKMPLQKAVVKRRTELGGTFTVAAVAAALIMTISFLYDAGAGGQVSLENARPAQRADLDKFRNRVEFNLTGNGRMTCGQWVRRNDTVTQSSMSTPLHVALGAEVASVECQDSASGPALRMLFPNFPTSLETTTLRVQFVDRPGVSVASASNFSFSFTTYSGSHRSMTNGTLVSSPNATELQRGMVGSVLSFNVIPRVFVETGNLRLFQVLLHGLESGTVTNASSAAIIDSPDTGVWLVVRISLLSNFLLETKQQRITGLIWTLSQIGGMWALSILFYFYIMKQLERIPGRLSSQDRTLGRLLVRQVARRHWKTLRLFVRILADFRTAGAIVTPPTAIARSPTISQSPPSGRATPDPSTSLIQDAMGADKNLQQLTRGSLMMTRMVPDVADVPLISSEKLEEVSSGLFLSERRRLRKLRQAVLDARSAAQAGQLGRSRMSLPHPRTRQRRTNTPQGQGGQVQGLMTPPPPPPPLPLPTLSLPSLTSADLKDEVMTDDDVWQQRVPTTSALLKYLEECVEYDKQLGNECHEFEQNVEAFADLLRPHSDL